RALAASLCSLADYSWVRTDSVWAPAAFPPAAALPPAADSERASAAQPVAARARTARGSRSARAEARRAQWPSAGSCETGSRSRLRALPSLRSFESDSNATPCPHRKRQNHACAFARRALHEDVSAMQFQPAPGYGQPDAGPGRLGAEIRLENPLLYVFGHPRTIIGYCNGTVAVLLGHGDLHAAG